jgi:hypothetical protein
VHGALALEPRKDKSRSTNGTRSTVGSTTGGVMTKEVGAVTGELEVTTRHRVEGTEVAVRCVGAEERYTVVGSPIGPDNANGLPPSEPRELYENLVRHLSTPGMPPEGNEQATSLLGYREVPGDGQR